MIEFNFLSLTSNDMTSPGRKKHFNAGKNFSLTNVAHDIARIVSDVYEMNHAFVKYSRLKKEMIKLTHASRLTDEVSRKQISEFFANEKKVLLFC